MVAYKRRASLLDDLDESDAETKKPRLPSTLAVPGLNALPRSVSISSFASSFQGTKQKVVRMTRGVLSRLAFQKKSSSEEKAMGKANDRSAIGGAVEENGDATSMRQVKGSSIPVKGLRATKIDLGSAPTTPEVPLSESIYPALPSASFTTSLLPVTDIPAPTLPAHMQKVPRGGSREAVDLTGEDDDDAQSSEATAGPSRTSSLGVPEESTTSMSPNEISEAEGKEAASEGGGRNENGGEDPDDPIVTASPTPAPMSPSMRGAKQSRRPPERPRISTEHHEQRYYPWMRRKTSAQAAVLQTAGLTPSPARSRRAGVSPQSRLKTEQTVQRSLRYQVRQLRLQRDKAATDGDETTARRRENQRKVFLRSMRLPGWSKKFTTNNEPSNGAPKPEHRTEAIYRQSIIDQGNDADKRQSLLGMINAWTSRGKLIEEAIKLDVPPTFDTSAVHKKAHTANIKAKTTRIIDPALADTLKRLTLEQQTNEKKVLDRFRPKLSQEQELKVKEIMADRGFKVTRSGNDVKASDIARCRPGDWLNDLVINAFGGLLQARADGKLEGAEYKNPISQGQGRNIHVYNSFFYEKLSKAGYSGVRRWSKNFDTFQKEIIIFPINMGNMHWTAAAINLKRKRFEYYDSLGDAGKHRREVFANLREYLKEEHEKKKGAPLPDLDEWTDFFADKAPHQNNGSDCGVFACQTLEALARGKDLSLSADFGFTAQDMPIIRKMMVWEIAEGKIAERTWGM